MTDDLDSLWRKYIGPRADPEMFSVDKIAAAIDVIRKARARAERKGRADLEARREAIVAWQLLTAETMAWVVDALRDGSEGDQAELRRFMLWSGAGFSRLDRMPGVKALLLPASLHKALTDAFDALDAGEVLELLKPAQSGRHGSAFQWDEARLRAVEYVHFFAGAGVTKKEARIRVSEATGNVATDTLRAWESDFQTGRSVYELKLASEAGRLSAVLSAGGSYEGFDENAIHKHRELTDPGLIAFGKMFEQKFGSRTQGVKPKR